MAVTVRGKFGGLNTDLYPTRIRSGAADVALNVVVSKGELKKRGGFAQYEDDVDGSATGVRSLYVAHFADATVYVMAKLASGTKNQQLYRRKSNASSFTAITTGATHNTADAGWWFTWADRVHCFDRAGGTRIKEASGSFTGYKAGLSKPSTGITFATASGGEKNGRYHVVWALRNNTTLEESICVGAQTPALNCLLTTDTGGIAISNWATLKALHTDYEWTHAGIYCSNGDTEWIPIGSGFECYAYRYYLDAVVAVGDASAGLNKADHVHDPSEMMTNAGGEPPGAIVGCVTSAAQAIYGQVYESAALVPDKISFSIPGYPTMVPKRETYSVGGDSKTFVPKPWDGFIRGALPGKISAMAYGAGVACAFTPTSTYVFNKLPDGRPYPVNVDPAKGCVGPQAAVGMPHGVFALGYRCLLWIKPNGSVLDLAVDRFTSTLDDIPAAQQAQAVAGYYGYRNQVWFAVVTAGTTYTKRILVYDIVEDELTVFEPSCFAATESITAMAELAYEGAEPTMLVGTDAGRILQYPTAAVDVNLAGSSVGYAATWRGYFGQERIAYDQAVDRLDSHNGANVADNVVVSYRAMNTPGETSTAETYTLTKDSLLEGLGFDFTRPAGHLYQLQFSSDNTVTTQWTIKDLAWRLAKTD